MRATLSRKKSGTVGRWWPAMALGALCLVAASLAPVRMAARRQCPSVTCRSSSSSIRCSVRPAPAGATYQWRVTAGTIESGQGSSSVTIGNLGVGASTQISVAVTGAGSACANLRPVSATLEPPACPTISARCPPCVKEGEPITFTAEVGGDPDDVPGFNWTVSQGVISGGQGTPAITVNTSGLAAGTSVTATLDGGGGCAAPTSCTTTVMPRPTKVSEFGAAGFAEEKASVHKFGDALRQHSCTEGYVVIYYLNDEEQVYVQGRADAIKAYLNTLWFLDPRVKTVLRKTTGAQRVELWEVPPGGAAPEPPPTP